MARRPSFLLLIIIGLIAGFLSAGISWNLSNGWAFALIAAFVLITGTAVWMRRGWIDGPYGDDPRGDLRRPDRGRRRERVPAREAPHPTR